MPQSHFGSLPSFQSGRSGGLVDATDLAKFFNMVLGTKTGIVAHAGGGIPLASPLNMGFNEVDVVATLADSVLLPPAIVGGWCWINNLGAAASLSAYTVQSNTNNAGAADTITPHGSVTPNASNAATTLATGHCTLFICTTLGQWKQVADFA